jgi:hypothetical protein
VSDEKEMPTGFTCKCGKRHEYPLYVAAHWDIVLTFKCHCGMDFTIYKGEAREDRR